MFSNAGKPNPSADGYELPQEQAEHGNAPSNFTNNNQLYHHRPPGNQVPTAAKPNPLNLVMFGADVCVMLAAFISALLEFFTLQWVDALEMTYILIFSIVLAILDTPLLPNHQIVKDYQTDIQKYVAILCRITGKGLVYIFLGSALASSMWANMKKNGFMVFLAVLIGFFVGLVGVIVLALGLVKSRNLNLLRQEFRKEPSQLETLYNQKALLHPESGLIKEEFKQLGAQARGVAFEDADIQLIFNALAVERQDSSYITRNDLKSWVESRWPVLL